MAEKPLGARTNVRNLDRNVAIQKRHIPLNGCCKFGVIAEVSSPQATVRDSHANLRLLGHPPKQRGNVLKNWVRTDDESQVSRVSHGVPAKVERLAHILCGLKGANRKPLEF
jgi:hypothetical protein